MKTELLAPAGSDAALRAAVLNGADAIYLGEKSFSARKNASNFTWDEIREAAKYCHARGVKIYLALNTLIKENELTDFEKAVKESTISGVDAIIVQDIGAADIIKKVCPDMPIHASTQLTCSNEYDVNILKKHGFSRVVLSRELSEKEVTRIHKNTDIELEAFVHGALCISLSGRCLMSSFIGKRSGNRGECAQPCRKLYTYKDKKGYFLSPRDLCLADEVSSMKKAGIHSFKIEGRMKSPEYVATVTRIYRKYLDNPSPLTHEDEDILKKIFVRGDGFTKAYFKNINTPEMMNYTISNDKITQRADEDVLKEARFSYREGVDIKKIPIKAYLKINAGEPSYLKFTDAIGNISEVFGEKGERAQKIALDAFSAKERIAKLGQTPFYLSDFECEIEADTTLSASSLNKLRRDCAEKLLGLREKINTLKTYSYIYPEKVKKEKRAKMLTFAQITFPYQFESVKDADRVLVPLNIWDKVNTDERCALLLPQVIMDMPEFEETIENLKLPKLIYASSLGMLSYFREKGFEVCADWGVNIYNSASLRFVSDFCDSATLSPELSLSEIKEICEKTNAFCEVLAYGKQTVMTSRACLVRGITDKCDCTRPIKITDEKGAAFTILGGYSHFNILLNSRPTFMADKMGEILKTGVNAQRLVFTDETAQEVKNIMDMYINKAQIVKPPLYTRGYFLNS